MHARTILAVLLPFICTFAYAGASIPSSTVPANTDVPIGESTKVIVKFKNAAASGNPGYGPFVDLFLDTTGADGVGAQVDDGITFVSATFMGVSVTSTVVPFHDVTGNATHPYAVDTNNDPIIVNAASVGLEPGDTMVVMQLPFGSFVPEQPEAEIEVTLSTSDLADLSTPLIIKSRGGFQFGNTPVEDPGTDPSILQAPTSNGTITPYLLKLKKTYVGPEHETATGPNFPRRYIISVDIADQQTVTNLAITDVLPNNLQYLQVIDTRAGGASVGTTAVSTPDGLPAPLTPGGTLTRRFASVTGGPGELDAELEYEFFVPLNDTAPAPVINATTGDDVTSIDDARAQGDWIPNDNLRDPPTTETSDVTPNDHTLNDKSIAIQKGVAIVNDVGAAGASPGDTLEYTLSFQVSDYFAFQNIVVNDLFSDGQNLDLTFTPTLAVNEHGNTTSGNFNGANYTLTTNVPNPPEAPGTNGGDRIEFRVSNELVLRGGTFVDGQMVGGAIPDNGTNMTGGGPPPNYFPFPFGATTGTIKFRTVIQEDFLFDFLPNDPSVDQNDVLDNDVTITGDLLNVTDLNPNGQSEADTSGDGVKIVNGTLTKSIYAINGVIGPYPNRVQVGPGDTVTYHITYNLMTSDFEGFAFTDYLPLPVFDATEISGPVLMPADSAPPPAGRFRLKDTDTFRALPGAPLPQLLTPPNPNPNPAANSITFHYGDYDNVGSVASRMEILLTVTVRGDPFADRLFLTNQVNLSGDSTNGGPIDQDGIIQIELTQPVLRITKGIVATNGVDGTFTPGTVGPVGFSAPTAPGAPNPRWGGTIHSANLATNPVNSNLSRVDAGDLVTYAIVVENAGSGIRGAFDVRIRDVKAAGMDTPVTAGGLNLSVTDGTGASISYTSIGAGLFDPTGGIELTDPGPTNPDPGALDRCASFDGNGDPNSVDGRNILVITYDLQVQGTVEPNEELTNTATLFNFAGLEGGQNHIPAGLSDDAIVTIEVPRATKSIKATSEPDTSFNPGINREEVAIGEIVRYRVQVRWPEGTAPNVQIQDLLPPGLTFINPNPPAIPNHVKLALVSDQNPIESTNPSGATLALALGNGPLGVAPWVSGDDATVSGITPTFDLPDQNIGSSGSITNNVDTYSTNTDPYFKLGDLTNNDRDDDYEFIVIEFNALVDNNNTSAANRNDAGDNRNNQARTRIDGAFTGTISPSNSTNRLRIVEPQITVVKTVNPLTGDAGNQFNYTITITNSNGANSTDAYNINLQDDIPASLTLLAAPPITLTPAGGTNGVVNTPDPANVIVDIAHMPEGGSLTVTYSCVAKGTAAPGEAIINDAKVTFTSLTGTNGTIGLPDNTTGSNNTGVPGTTTGERTGSHTPTQPNDYYAVDDATCTISPVAPVKSIVMTSEQHTANSNIDVAIGEIVQFRIEARVPESTSNNFQIQDQLPVGMQYLEGTARLALVSNLNEIESTDPVGDTLGLGLGNAGTFGTPPWFSGNEATVGAHIPTFVMPDVNVGSDNSITADPDAFNSGTDIFFKLGDLVNTDSDGDQEFVVIEFNVLVLNEAGNQNGTNLVNTVQVFVDGAANGNPSSITNIVREPIITNVDKHVIGFTNTPSTTDTYEVTFTNSGAADAFEVRFLDNLPAADLTLNTASISIALDGGSPVPAGPWFIGNAVDLTLATLKVGETATIRYTATLLTMGATVSNTATVTYTSLPGTGTPTPPPPTNFNQTGSVTPGGSGATNGERNGTSGGPNDYNDDDDEDIGSLGDFVWYDVDGDGTQDAGEPGISGVDVNLTWAGPDNNFGTGADNVSISTTTDLAGAYLFSGLPQGNYRVAVDTADLPGGMNATYDLDGGNDSTADLTLNPGQNRTDVDFGYVGTGTIGDFVWNDQDGDTNQDVGEPGIPTVTVNMTWAGNDGSFSTADDYAFTADVTDGAGAYQFGNLPAGQYRVDPDQSTVPSNMTLTTGNDPLTVNLGAGANIDTADFGYQGDSSLGDLVWFDLNGDTAFAGEPGIDAVTLTVTWSGPDNNLGTAADNVNYVITNQTSGGGLYGVSGIPLGNYRVTVQTGTLPTGMTATYDLDGGLDDTADFNLPAATNRTDVDFGYTGTGSLGDRVWYDLDGDGVDDAGEPGLPGITVDLIWAGPDNNLGTAADNQSWSQVTAANGAYTFNRLPQGNYRVSVQTGTLPGGMNATYDLDGTPNSTTDLALNAGQNRTDADFGYTGTGSIGDFVWNDQDGDTNQDAGEPGIPTVTVNMTWDGVDGTFGTGDDFSFPAQITTAGGAYLFPRLPAGDFRVDPDQTTVPANMTLTTPTDPIVVTLGAGANNLNVDFGYQGDSSLGDFVWYDVDGDGVDDAGEPGISSVDLTVTWAGPNGTFGNADDVVYTITDTTNGSGIYGLSGLPQGNWRVAVQPASLPAGFTPTYDLDGGNDHTADLALGAAQNRVDVDFGYTGTGSIGDFVWNDRDGDTNQDGNEPGLPSVTVALTWAGQDGTLGTGDDLSYTDDVTDANGNYLFERLPAGLYRVDPDPSALPANLTLTTGNDPLNVNLGAGANDLSADFGYQGDSSIGDYVWNDENNDTVQDGAEPGISGVTVDLTWAGANGSLGDADDVLYADVTDALGAYLFDGLPSGLFEVNVDDTTLPGNLTLTTANDPSNVNMPANTNRLDLDFGYVGDSSIGDFVWNDMNNDGVQDAGEPGIPGVTVNMTWYGPDNTFGTGDDVLYTRVTDAAGGYLFSNLPAGTFRVDPDQTTVPANMSLTTGNDPLDIVLPGGIGNFTADFGYVGNSSLGDRVWYDLDGDGLQDGGEPGLPGAIVDLVWAGPNGTFGDADDVNYSTTTNATGNYLFPGLPQGNHRVSVQTGSLPTGFTETFDLDGGNDSTADVVLGAGENRTDVDFGYTGTGSIGDFVWNDRNGDTVQDAIEPGIPTVSVNLTWGGVDDTLGTGDDFVFTADVTDATGMYLFTRLPAGVYRVDPDGTTVPANMTLTTGNDPLTVNLTAGQNDLSADFGYQGDSSIGDFVWNDQDGDTNQDTGEPGIPEVDVNLTWAGPDGTLGTGDDVVYATVTTDAAGGYLFPGLPEGLFRVDVDESTLPSSVVLTTGNEPADVNLPGATAHLDADFGYQGSSAVGDFVWYDYNADGNQCSCEVGLPNIGLTMVFAGKDGIFGTADDITYTTTTDADGLYAFTGLPAGLFRLDVDNATLPIDFELTGGSDPATTSLNPGQTDLTVDFGFTDCAPPIITSQPFADPNPVIAGVPTMLSVQAVDVQGRPLTYTWDFGDGTGGTGAVLTHAFVSPGTYTVTVVVTNNCGLSDTGTVDVDVMVPVPNNLVPTTGNPPVIEADWTANCLEVTFTASATDPEDGDLDLIIWDFGDGTYGSGQNTTHTYAAAGVYTVQAMTYDSDMNWRPINMTVPVTSCDGTGTVLAAAGACFRARFNFAKTNKDRMLFFCDVQMPDNFQVGAQPLSCNLAGYTFSGTLDSKGRILSRGVRIVVRQMRGKTRVMFRLSKKELKEAFDAVVNADINRQVMRQISFTVKIGDQLFLSRSDLIYSSKKGKKGSLSQY